MADTPTGAQIPGRAAYGGDHGTTMSLLERVRPSWAGPTLSQPRTSAYVAGAVAGLRSAGLSLGIVTVPLLAAWALAAHVTAGWTQALRLAAGGWLLVHHVTIGYDGGQLGLAPLGLMAVPLLAVYRSARRLASEPLLSQGFSSTSVNVRAAAQAVVGIAASYSLAALVVALLVSTGPARPVLWQALVAPALVAAVGGAAGVVRGHPRSPLLRREIAGWLPERVRSTVRPGLIGAGCVLAAGAVLVGVAVVTSLDRVTALHRALNPDAFGSGLLVAGQAGYLPDLAAWGVAWLAGPGFAVGAGSMVAPGTVHLGVLPVVPVLGALPGTPFVSPWAVLGPLAVPVLAGVVAGWASARRAAAADLLWVSRLLDALGAVVVGAAVVTSVVALSTGPIGPGRLAEVGANALVVGPFLAMELALGALPAAAAVTWWRRRGTDGLVEPAISALPTPPQTTSASAPGRPTPASDGQPPSSVD